MKIYTDTMIVYFVASTYTNKYAACRLLVSYGDQEDNGYIFKDILNWKLHQGWRPDANNENIMKRVYSKFITIPVPLHPNETHLVQVGLDSYIVEYYIILWKLCISSTQFHS